MTALTLGAALTSVLLAGAGVAPGLASSGKPLAQQSPASMGPPSGAPGAEAGSTGASPGSAPPPGASASPDLPEEPAGVKRSLGWISERMTVHGYLKLGYFFVGPGADDALVGSHNGFRLLGVRLGGSLRPADTVEVVASIDGSIGKRRETDALTGNRVVELRDAYVRWAPSRFLRLRGGQFKPPFNGEALLPDGQLPFISRSIITDGILPPDGFPRAGLALERQVGVELSSDRLGDGVSLRYAAAVVNGNGQNVLNNDNNYITPVGRITLDLGEAISLGANAFYNRETEGVRPDRLSTTRIGVGGDVAVNVGGFSALGMVLARQTRHLGTTPEEPDLLPQERGLGFMGYGRYLHESSGIELGARFTQYDPSSVEVGDLMREVTGMLGYRAPFAPVRVLVQYTWRDEESPTAVNNNGIDAMLQASW